VKSCMMCPRPAQFSPGYQRGRWKVAYGDLDVYAQYCEEHCRQWCDLLNGFDWTEKDNRSKYLTK
jgi:hypothetical protein